MPNTVLADLTLEYDTNKNIINRTSNGDLTSFQYDELNRLTYENGPMQTQDFIYDANGNRLSDGNGSYGFITGSNIMDSQYGNAVKTDAAGNMIDNGKGLTFTYNNVGRLKTVSKDGELVATYTYNAFGQRTRKVLADGTTTIYHYDLHGQLLEETLQDGTLQTTYLWRDNKPTAVIVEPETPYNSSTTEDKVIYLHADHLNTPREATDETQTTVWSWESDAFGATPANDDVDGDGSLVAVNLRFPGQYYDAESSLYYNWNRYYDSASGRYVRSDPIGLEGGRNTFPYSVNNSLIFVDTNGLRYKEGFLLIFTIAQLIAGEISYTDRQKSTNPYEPRNKIAEQLKESAPERVKKKQPPKKLIKPLKQPNRLPASSSSLPLRPLVLTGIGAFGWAMFGDMGNIPACEECNSRSVRPQPSILPRADKYQSCTLLDPLGLGINSGIELSSEEQMEIIRNFSR